MKIVRVAGGCDPNPNCPTLYRTDRGTYLVQGTVVAEAELLTELTVPDGEALIEVPEVLLDRGGAFDAV